MKRTRLMIIGESGGGVLSVGEIITDALRSLGYYTISDREYPSLIKGGQSKLTINIDDEPMEALSHTADIMVSFGKKPLLKFHPCLRDGGVLIHGYERLWGIKDTLTTMESRGVEILHTPARALAESLGGNSLMENMVLLGLLWKALDLPYDAVAEQVTHRFAKYPKLLEIDLKVLSAAYQQADPSLPLVVPQQKAENTIAIDGAHAIALGAAHAGMRLYVGYPMSPSTGILKHTANIATEIGIAFKQAEDEITAVQMALGGMYAGTRSLTATSGGGFDLMTETVSLSGITETPLVIVIAQRPGPGTGLPTWTAQGDLHLAIRGGHGEFARLVIGVSNPTDCFDLIQHAFNYAERFQIPVMLLTDKVTQETKATVSMFDQNSIPIERGLVTDEEELAQLSPHDRFKHTPSGVSPRWVPGASPAYYFANGDEHDESGTLTEDAEPAGRMIHKRIKKLDALKDALPEPEVVGPETADISFIGWGSTATTIRDAIAAHNKTPDGPTVNYLHYTYVWPLKTERLQTFMEANDNVHLIEQNGTGQLGELLEPHLTRPLSGKYLKWDGRPFFLEDVANYIHTHTA